MIIKTVKVKKLWLAAAIFLAAAVFIFLVVYGVVHAYTNDEVLLDTESRRQEFIASLGWEVGETYDESSVITIPAEFDDVYSQYNELQKQQGFNLERYKGEQAEIYSYAVSNYSDRENVCINLITFNGKLIGGDVSCNELDGFMQGLKKKS